MERKGTDEIAMRNRWKVIVMRFSDNGLIDRQFGKVFEDEESARNAYNEYANPLYRTDTEVSLYRENKEGNWELCNSGNGKTGK